MPDWDKIIATAFGIAAMIAILRNGQAFNQILSTGGGVFTQTLNILSGGNQYGFGT